MDRWRGCVAFDRFISILFYILIALVTCLMAYRASGYQHICNMQHICNIQHICNMQHIKNMQHIFNMQHVKTHQNRQVFLKYRYLSRAEFLDKLYTIGIFIILFMIMSLRFDIGNDYGQYTQTAHEAFVGGYVVTEFGFNMLVRIVYGLTGGEYYEVIFAIFAFATLWFFFKAMKRQSVNFAQTFFLFMTLGLYFQTFNTMRYYLALAIALFSMKYVLEKDYIKFVFWILAAAMFHKSVLIVIPVYWIATFEWKRWHILIGVILCAVCLIGKDFVMKLALLLYPSYKDTIYLEGGSSLTSIIRIIAVLVLYCWYCIYSGKELKSKRWYKEFRFYGQLNMLALAASTFFSFLPVVTRIAYYFGVSQLFLIPLICENIADVRSFDKAGNEVGIKKEKALKFLVFICCVIYFILFLLQAHKDGVGLIPYKSWLFETERYNYK